MSLSADAVHCGGWEQAEASRQASHQHRAKLIKCAGLQGVRPGLRALDATDAREEDDGSERGDSRERCKAHRRRDAERCMSDEQGEYAADGAIGQRHENDDGVTPTLELKIEQKENGEQAYGNNDGEALLFFAEGVELAGPGIAVTLRKLDLVL